MNPRGNFLWLCSFILLIFWNRCGIEASTLIGNFHFQAPAGIAFIKDDAAAFMLDPGWHPNPGMAAPDDSIHKNSFHGMQIDWGRTGDSVVGKLSSENSNEVTFKLSSGWPGFVSTFTPGTDGIIGKAVTANQQTIIWNLKLSSPPVFMNETQFTVQVSTDHPIYFAAGFGKLKSFDTIDETLNRATQAYEMRRPKAEGTIGDFLGAIADNLNNSRLYSNDNDMLAISVSRFWTRGINNNPYFCWDSFFSGLLACLDNPQMGRQTVRAILSCQTEDGLVPNFGHWVKGPGYGSGTLRVSADRSQPPVGALCVWKMHQLQPDLDFLREVYPKLVKWHEWWMVTRNARHDGLLEWGANDGQMVHARYETGWDDTPQFTGATMVGHTMNAYAVDLNSLWSMDAHFLSLIAKAIGKNDDAKKFAQQAKEMNQRINDHLWNEQLGIYCSRMWDGADGKPGAFLTRLTPMNFYPLICGAADANRAKHVLAIMTNTNQFWGEWILPTVSRADPFFKQQNYWRGKVWGPVNYLVFQGVKRYAPPEIQSAYAEKSVKLFMQNWLEKGVCSENYFSATGQPGSDPHYTWGALLCLIAFESVVDLHDDGSEHQGFGFNEDVKMFNIPWGGKLHTVEFKSGK